METTTMARDRRRSLFRRESLDDIKKMDPPKVQIIIAVINGILSGELGLCDYRFDHQKERHSIRGWVDIFLAQEEGMIYSSDIQALTKIGEIGRRTFLRSHSNYLKLKEKLSLTHAECTLVFSRHRPLKDLIYACKLLEKGFRFGIHDPVHSENLREEREDTYYFFVYEGVDERYDLSNRNRATYARSLYKRFFPTEEVDTR